MPLAMPRFSGGIRRVGRGHQHRRPGHAGAAGGEHADGEDQARRCVVMNGTSAVPSATSSDAEQQHAAGAVAVGDDAGERLRQPPPQLAERRTPG